MCAPPAGRLEAEAVKESARGCCCERGGFFGRLEAKTIAGTDFSFISFFAVEGLPRLRVRLYRLIVSSTAVDLTNPGDALAAQLAAQQLFLNIFEGYSISSLPVPFSLEHEIVHFFNEQSGAKSGSVVEV